MEDLRGLPFKIGDDVELKSFETGYRGAWFRCKIKGTGQRGVALDLYDYPDDEDTWMESLYERVPGESSMGSKGELMLRPQFPPLYSEGEAPELNSLSEVIVVTNGAWKVGDLVDWLCEEAYWSGTIIKFLNDDKAQIKSPPEPLGEDMEYEALCKDLRPSLIWSPKSGWTVPVPGGKGNSCPCAKLIKPVNQEGQRRAEGRRKDADEKGSAFCKDQLPETEEAAERIKVDKNIPLNSSKCDSVESLIMDMEELLNRVKWMKRILEPPPNSANVGWKFQECRAGDD